MTAMGSWSRSDFRSRFGGCSTGEPRGGCVPGGSVAQISLTEAKNAAPVSVAALIKDNIDLFDENY
jgi:hypothetical protein